MQDLCGKKNMRSNPKTPSTWRWIEEGQFKQTRRPQPTTLPWKHQYSTSSLLRCAYKRLSSPSESLSSAEIGTEEAAYLLFILRLQLNSALSWTDGHARLLRRKISRVKPPWTRSVCRLHSYILISLPLPSCTHREVQSIHAHLHKIGTRAQEVKHPGVAEMPHWCQGRGKVEGLSIVHSWNCISKQLFQGSVLWVPLKPSVLPTNP